MKISFSFDPFGDYNYTDGKHKFLARLAKQMKKDGHKINVKHSDVHIYLPRKKRNIHARINVLRLDGLIMNTRWNYKVKNRKLKECIDISDALVYQGKFCERAYNKFMGVDYKPFDIIPNGASSDEFLPRNPQNFFLANTKWRPHKRLETTTNCFLRALKKGLDSDLVVTGEPDYKIKHPRIKYIGWKKRKKLTKLLSQAIASMHLTWLDWCPNAMVEAIVARCPVIYTISGGHREIAENSGIGIEDTYWKWNLIDLYDPPLIDKDKVADAMIRVKREKIKYPVNKDLDIKTVSDKYIAYFHRLLKNV